MGALNYALLAFNRGRISTLALARSDFKRLEMSAETQTNWMPRSLGSMMLRPGWEYTGASRGNLRSVSLPFVFALGDTARLELTNGIMRVWVDDELVTRPAVTTAVSNGTFDTDLTGWTDLDGGSAVSSWVTGGYMSLVGTGNAAALRRQQVTVGGADAGIRHALTILIERGPVTIRVGSTAGGDQYIGETTLRTGAHSLAFTPTGDFYIDLFNYNEPAALVNSITVAPAGVMEIPAPWLEADLNMVRIDQSGDIVFVACSGYRQRQIERRGTDSWSIVLYQSNDGPFRIQNVGPITITPNGTSGDISLTASAPLFRSTQIGTLFRLTQSGQRSDVELTGADQFSAPIRVTGVEGTRAFAIIITGTWSATITLQYSVGEPGDWVDATSGSFTSNVSISYDDTLDNQVIYYRIGIKSGNYVSGTANATLSLSSGSQTGTARVTGFTSSTVVSAAVLEPFGSTGATSDWSESYWSDYRGFPSSVAFYEGRLWWSGKDRVQGSVSDAFFSFDDETEGDSGPINRSIGSGPVDTIYWLMPVQRLLLGGAGTISAVRSSSFDEPLTPTNYNRKDISTQGSATPAAVKIDTSAVFVQRGGIRVFEAAYSGDAYDYVANDLTVHVPEIGEPGIVKVVVQHQPEKRIHCIRSDGTVAIQVYDPGEEINCWIDVETAGFVEDAVVLPGTVEDQVYYTVRRTINGSTRRYHEKWALESECQGATLNKQADSFVAYTGAQAPLNALSHLEGQEVVCWADGTDRGVFTVSGGTIPVNCAQGAVVGLGYEARYKSVKLAYGVENGTALCQKKRINRLGVIAQNIHPLGLRYGPDFDTLDDMPAVEDYARIDQNAIRSQYDEEMFEFPGDWSTDSRLCLTASAPRPVTLLACVIGIEAHSK